MDRTQQQKQQACHQFHWTKNKELGKKHLHYAEYSFNTDKAITYM